VTLFLALLGCPSEPAAAPEALPAVSDGCPAPPDAFLAALGSDRLVTRDDLAAALVRIDADVRSMRPDAPPMLCPTIRADFDADGDDDVAALVASGGPTRLVVGLADGGAFRIEELRSFPRHAEGVYTALWLKPPGAGGPLDNDNFAGLDRSSPEAAALKERAGIVVCVPSRADEAGLPAAIDDSLCYGEETWTFAGGAWKSYRAMD
jgi:hypothetical protein